MNNIIQAKDFAKQIRQSLKSYFPSCKFSIRTKGNNIFITWYNIHVNEICKEVNNIIDQTADNYYIDVNEIELWREISREYMDNNKEWSKENRMETIKLKNKKHNTDDNTDKTIAHKAMVLYSKDKVNVIFDDKISYVFDYRKSWSHKKYINNGMKQLKIMPSYDFCYGWDMSAIVD